MKFILFTFIALLYSSYCYSDDTDNTITNNALMLFKNELIENKDASNEFVKNSLSTLRDKLGRSLSIEEVINFETIILEYKPALITAFDESLIEAEQTHDSILNGEIVTGDL